MPGSSASSGEVLRLEEVDSIALSFCSPLEHPLWHPLRSGDKPFLVLGGRPENPWEDACRHSVTASGAQTLFVF